jgi:signal transduction histidine kinase
MLVDAVTPERGSEGSRALLGRLAGVLFLGSGLITLATLPIAPSDQNLAVAIAIGFVAVAIGSFAWLAPWGRWHPRASLALVPPAFTLIAFGNLYGGSDTHTYGVFFVVAFVWIGIAHGRWASLAMAPFAAVAYVVPIYFLPGNLEAGISSTAMTIPLCVLVGESLAWGAERLERTELELAHERFVADRLRALDEMKDTFMSAISHELRTPITISRGHLEVLEEQPTSDELRAAIDVVIDELDRMGRLVEDITTLISTGDTGFLRLEPVEVGGFANQIGVKAAPLLGDRPLIIEDVSVDGIVKADPHRLAQALLNLISNAGRHGTGEGAIRLRIKDEPGWWRFEVADAGGGVPTHLLPTLFEPFRHGPASTGTGLGLAIVRGIAEAHDGQAGVDNDPGRGATFWIRLPR